MRSRTGTTSSSGLAGGLGAGGKKRQPRGRSLCKVREAAENKFCCNDWRQISARMDWFAGQIKAVDEESIEDARGRSQRA